MHHHHCYYHQIISIPILQIRTLRPELNKELTHFPLESDLNSSSSDSETSSLFINGIISSRLNRTNRMEEMQYWTPWDLPGWTSLGNEYVTWLTSTQPDCLCGSGLLAPMCKEPHLILLGLLTGPPAQKIAIAQKLSFFPRFLQGVCVLFHTIFLGVLLFSYLFIWTTKLSN